MHCLPSCEERSIDVLMLKTVNMSIEGIFNLEKMRDFVYNSDC